MYDKPKLQHDLVVCSNNLVMFLMWPLYVINTKCAKVTVMSCWHSWHRQVAPTCLHRRKKTEKRNSKWNAVGYCPYPLRATSMTVQIVGKFTPVCCMQMMCVRERVQHFFSSVCSLCEKPLTAPYVYSILDTCIWRLPYCHFPLSLNGRLHLERKKQKSQNEL